MQVSRVKALRLSTMALALAAVTGLAACETEGKVAETTTFDVSQAAPKDIARALDRDGRVVLRGGIVFETDSATLSEAGRSATARLAAALQSNPTRKVAVVGHTDNTGAFAYNLDLSRRRAEAMTNSLINDHGIAMDRLAPVGVGPLAPVASNDTAEGRTENRRVEVVVVQ